MKERNPKVVGVLVAVRNYESHVKGQPRLIEVTYASGAKYGRVGIEYWEHQGEAIVDFFGNKLSCTPVP